MNKKIFFAEEHPEGYMIKVNYEVLDFEKNKFMGSYGVLAARVLGLSFADWLRYCRDEHGAKIRGKNAYYPYPLFPIKPTALVAILNREIEDILKLISE